MKKKRERERKVANQISKHTILFVLLNLILDMTRGLRNSQYIATVLISLLYKLLV
jgi:hypothetical protein